MMKKQFVSVLMALAFLFSVSAMAQDASKDQKKEVKKECAKTCCKKGNKACCKKGDKTCCKKASAKATTDKTTAPK
jgi:hypothetical protein